MVTSYRRTLDLQAYQSRHFGSKIVKDFWIKVVEFDSKMSESCEIEETTRGFHKRWEFTRVESTISQGKGVKSIHMHFQKIGDIG